MTRIWLEVLGLVTRGLGRVAGFWRRLAVAAERRLAAAQPLRSAGPAEVAPVADSGPPAHWLARVAPGGPPAHWLAYIRERAPGAVFRRYRAAGAPRLPRADVSAPHHSAALSGTESRSPLLDPASKTDDPEAAIRALRAKVGLRRLRFSDGSRWTHGGSLKPAARDSADAQLAAAGLADAMPRLGAQDGLSRSFRQPKIGSGFSAAPSPEAPRPTQNGPGGRTTRGVPATAAADADRVVGMRSQRAQAAVGRSSARPGAVAHVAHDMRSDENQTPKLARERPQQTATSIFRSVADAASGATRRKNALIRGLRARPRPITRIGSDFSSTHAFEARGPTGTRAADIVPAAAAGDVSESAGPRGETWLEPAARSAETAWPAASIEQASVAQPKAFSPDTAGESPLPWPTLPGPSSLEHAPPSDGENEAGLRAWRRRHRLDDEQRGILWNGSLY